MTTSAESNHYEQLRGARSGRIFIHTDLHHPSSVIEFPRDRLALCRDRVAASGRTRRAQVSALRAGCPVGPAQAAGPGTAGRLPGAAR
jgi:hypothetical protein